MALDTLIFQHQFDLFDRQIFRETGRRFVSFQEGLPYEWESYKEALRTIARDRLGFGRWRSNDIGSGIILNHVIDAIEVAKRQDVPRNNLVAWQPRHGPQNQPHRELLKARGDRPGRERIERWCFQFFRGDLQSQTAFEQFVALAGGRYDLVAYLFFLKDWHNYMPIAPVTFDEAFAALGIELKTSRRCSWDNYSRFNGALVDVQNALREILAIDARLSTVRRLDPADSIDQIRSLNTTQDFLLVCI
jgi:hypothetical protein